MVDVRFPLAVVAVSDLRSRLMSDSFFTLPTAVVLSAAVVGSCLLLVWQRRLVVRGVLSLLRRRGGRVVYVSSEESALIGNGVGECVAGTRLTVLTPSRVIKRQDSLVAVIEAEKTRRAAVIAELTGLFEVPRLIGGNPESGRIDFERIAGVEPMWSWLVGRRGACVTAMAERVGRSLAAVHETMRLPVGWGERLPDPWRVEPWSVAGLSTTQDHEVVLHGDFNAWNLLVAGNGRRLVITDWAGSDLCSPLVARGPWVFDAAWLVITLFRSRLGRIERISEAELFSRVFLESYGASRGLPEAPVLCGAYLNELMPVLDRPEIRGRREQWLRPKLDVLRLSRFATGLCERPVRRSAA